MQRYVEEKYNSENFEHHRGLTKLSSDNKVTVSIEGVEQKEYSIHSLVSPCEVCLLLHLLVFVAGVVILCMYVLCVVANVDATGLVMVLVYVTELATFFIFSIVLSTSAEN